MVDILDPLASRAVSDDANDEELRALVMQSTGWLSLEKYDRSIDMHMSNLRKKMAQHDAGSMIITVRGHGYQLSDEI